MGQTRDWGRRTQDALRPADAAIDEVEVRAFFGSELVSVQRCRHRPERPGRRLRTAAILLWLLAATAFAYALGNASDNQRRYRCHDKSQKG